MWSNFPLAFDRLTPHAFVNSVIFTASIVIGQGLFTTMGGFAFARLGWQDTYQGLILPILASGAFGTFLFRQFFLTIPGELGDAAVVDGANPLDIYWRIYLPLSKPAMTAYGVITALSAWNMYLWPLIVTQSKELRTLTLVIAQLSGQMNAELHLMMAAVTICLLPILAVYIIGQRFFVEGITMSGLKG
jgi:multiple sugar transport system permease protein